MDETNFNSRITAELTRASLLNIYNRLDDEETPHAIRVRKVANLRQVIIYCDAEHINYFDKILRDEI